METHSIESLPPTHQIVEYRRIPKAEVSLACNNDPQVVSIYWGWWGVNLVYHTKLYPVFSCSGVVLSLKWADFQRGGFTMQTCGAEFETILKRFWSEALSATIRSSHIILGGVPKHYPIIHRVDVPCGRHPKPPLCYLFTDLQQLKTARLVRPR